MTGHTPRVLGAISAPRRPATPGPLVQTADVQRDPCRCAVGRWIVCHGNVQTGLVCDRLKYIFPCVSLHAVRATRISEDQDLMRPPELPGSDQDRLAEDQGHPRTLGGIYHRQPASRRGGVAALADERTCVAPAHAARSHHGTTPLAAVHGPWSMVTTYATINSSCVRAGGLAQSRAAHPLPQRPQRESSREDERSRCHADRSAHRRVAAGATGRSST